MSHAGRRAATSGNGRFRSRRRDPASPRCSIRAVQVQLRTDQQLTVPLACGSLALLLTVVTSSRSSGPPAGASRPCRACRRRARRWANARTRSTRTSRPSSNAYDGQFYWGIAIDPLARGYIHQRFDNASYRYGHPLSAGSAGSSSGDHVAARCRRRCSPSASRRCSRPRAGRGTLGQLLGRLRLAGAVRRAQPGLIFAATHDLTEPLSAALMFTGLIAYLQGPTLDRGRAVRAPHPLEGAVRPRSRPGSPSGISSASGTAHRERRDPRRRASLPARVWWIYAHHQLGNWFTSGTVVSACRSPAGGARSSTPACGRTRELLPVPHRRGACSPILIPLLALLTIAGVRALRLRTPVDVVYLLLGLLVVCLVLGRDVHPPRRAAQRVAAARARPVRARRDAAWLMPRRA